MAHDLQPLDELEPIPAAPQGSRLRRAFEFIADLLINGVTILALFLLIRFVLISPYQIKGYSMEPNFHDNELVLIDKVSYRFHSPARGDVVILRPPFDPTVFYVKRVVGLPGEKIQFRNGKVVVFNEENPDGLTLDESYIPDDMSTYAPSTDPIPIPDDSYFVLGDNRLHSNDSRFWGRLPEKNIIGKAWVILWPPKDMGVVQHQGYVQ